MGKEGGGGGGEGRRGRGGKEVVGEGSACLACFTR